MVAGLCNFVYSFFRNGCNPYMHYGLRVQMVSPLRSSVIHVYIHACSVQSENRTTLELSSAKLEFSLCFTTGVILELGKRFGGLSNRQMSLRKVGIFGAK